jgi:hypothetical protein
VISGATGPVTTSFSIFLSGELSVLTLPPAGDRQTQASAYAIVQAVINGRIVTGDAFFQDRYCHDGSGRVPHGSLSCPRW